MDALPAGSPQALRLVFSGKQRARKNWGELKNDAGGGTRSSSPRALLSKPSGEPVRQAIALTAASVVRHSSETNEFIVLFVLL